MTVRYPKMCLHKKSGRAYVTVSGRQIYLGDWGSDEAKTEYSRIISQMSSRTWEQKPILKEKLLVGELIVHYLHWAKTYYCTPDGKPTNRYRQVYGILKFPIQHFGNLLAIEFGPRTLRSLLDKWIETRLTRKEINARMQVVRAVFRWAVAEEILPSDSYQKLRAVRGLQKGHTKAKDNPPVQPANPADVEAAIQHMPPAIAAITKLMVHSGARCGEIVALRPCDIDRSSTVWTYRPTSHKTSHREKNRVIYFGTLCRKVISEFVDKCGSPTEYLFCPQREEAKRNQERSANRIVKLYPSHAKRNEALKRKPKKRAPLRSHYSTTTVGQAIERACVKAGVKHFTPHQLRHLAATKIRSEFGVDVARAVLGHSLASVTEIYSQAVDEKLALLAIEKLG
jgi:integrase